MNPETDSWIDPTRPINEQQEATATKAGHSAGSESGGAAGSVLEVRYIEKLREVVAPKYRAKYGRSLTWEPGWGWELIAFLDHELNGPNDRTQPLRES